MDGERATDGNIIVSIDEDFHSLGSNSKESSENNEPATHSTLPAAHSTLPAAHSTLPASPVTEFSLIVTQLYATESKKMSEVIAKFRTGLAFVIGVSCIFYSATILSVSCKVANRFAGLTSLGSFIAIGLALIASIELFETSRDFKEALVQKFPTQYSPDGQQEVLMKGKLRRMKFKILLSFVEIWGFAVFGSYIAILVTMYLVNHCRK